MQWLGIKQEWGRLPMQDGERGAAVERAEEEGREHPVLCEAGFLLGPNAPFFFRFLPWALKAL